MKLIKMNLIIAAICVPQSINCQHFIIVQALVENRANVNVKNDGGITVLSIAELKAQPEIIRLLEEAGAIK